MEVFTTRTPENVKVGSVLQASSCHCRKNRFLACRLVSSALSCSQPTCRTSVSWPASHQPQATVSGVRKAHHRCSICSSSKICCTNAGFEEDISSSVLTLPTPTLSFGFFLSTSRSLIPDVPDARNNSLYAHHL